MQGVNKAWVSYEPVSCVLEKNAMKEPDLDQHKHWGDFTVWLELCSNTSIVWRTVILYNTENNLEAEGTLLLTV